MVDKDRARPWRTAGYSESYILRVEATSLAIENAVECTYCLAIKGARCVTNSGNFAWMPHNVRHNAWRQTVVTSYASQDLALKVLDWLDNTHRWDTFPAAHDALREMVERELVHARDDASRNGSEDHSGCADGGAENRGH